jgi:hypothetical protein
VGVSCLRRLLEAVEGAVQPADQIRVSGVDEAGGLVVVEPPSECHGERRS